MNEVKPTAIALFSPASSPSLPSFKQLELEASGLETAARSLQSQALALGQETLMADQLQEENLLASQAIALSQRAGSLRERAEIVRDRADIAVGRSGQGMEPAEPSLPGPALPFAIAPRSELSASERLAAFEIDIDLRETDRPDNMPEVSLDPSVRRNKLTELLGAARNLNVGRAITDDPQDVNSNIRSFARDFQLKYSEYQDSLLKTIAVLGEDISPDERDKIAEIFTNAENNIKTSMEDAIKLTTAFTRRTRLGIKKEPDEIPSDLQALMGFLSVSVALVGATVNLTAALPVAIDGLRKAKEAFEKLKLLEGAKGVFDTVQDVKDKAEAFQGLANDAAEVERSRYAPNIKIPNIGPSFSPLVKELEEFIGKAKLTTDAAASWLKSTGQERSLAIFQRTGRGLNRVGVRAAQEVQSAAIVVDLVKNGTSRITGNTGRPTRFKPYTRTDVGGEFKKRFEAIGWDVAHVDEGSRRVGGPGIGYTQDLIEGEFTATNSGQSGFTRTDGRIGSKGKGITNNHSGVFETRKELVESTKANYAQQSLTEPEWIKELFQ